MSNLEKIFLIKVVIDFLVGIGFFFFNFHTKKYRANLNHLENTIFNEREIHINKMKGLTEYYLREVKVRDDKIKKLEDSKNA